MSVHADDVRDTLRQIVERAMPWYNRQEADARDRRTEHIRQRSIAARIAVEQLTPEAIEQIRAAYAAYAATLCSPRVAP
jgi:hypothetical protein